MSSIDPTPYQAALLQIPEEWNIFAGGGRGGGKTFGGLLLALRHLEQHGRQARVLIMRESFPAAVELWDKLVELLTAAYGKGITVRKQEHRIILPNGGQVEIGYLDGAEAYSRYQGRSFTFLLFDEVGQVREMRWVAQLRSNLRAPEGVPTRVVMTANPGGPGHSTLHRRFVSAGPAWRPFEADGETWAVCPSTFKDNPFIDHDDYLKKLAAACAHDPALLRAWTEGLWSEVGGAFFADVLSEAVHMTPEPWRHTVTPEWKPTIALDWGVSAPCITLLGVVSPGVDGFPAGSVCVIDELAVVDSSDLNQGLRWPVSMVAEEVASMCGRWGVRHPKGVADDAYGLDESLLDALRRHGLRVQRPKKERIAGWALVRELLHNAKERNGRPGLYISARCKYTWATLPFLPRSELRREDVDTRAADHAADALRYLCMDLHGRPRTGSGRHLGMF